MKIKFDSAAIGPHAQNKANKFMTLVIFLTENLIKYVKHLGKL